MIYSGRVCWGDLGLGLCIPESPSELRCEDGTCTVVGRGYMGYDT
jgi:hypothetical protein